MLQNNNVWHWLPIEPDVTHNILADELYIYYDHFSSRWPFIKQTNTEYSCLDTTVETEDYISKTS